jgi:hypothetical protein
MLCAFQANDADGDGHATNDCQSTDGTPIILGDDCDDSSASTYPGAWDGPMGDGHKNACDGIDEDCDGKIDDGALMNGTTCTCAPDDVQKCSTDSGGQTITWPTGTPVGACKYGSQTCSKMGTWGPCTGAQGPTQESCNTIDDDCDGMVDNGPLPDNVPDDAVFFVYDGDDDDHAGSPASGYTQIHACDYAKPTDPPMACSMLALPCGQGTTAAQCCPAGRWKLATGIPQDDCDDRNPTVNPAAIELCNHVDDDCDGMVDNGPAPDDVPSDAKYFYYDGDGDDHAGSAANGYKPVHACAYDAPSDPPAACTSLPLPCGLGTTLAQCCPPGQWKLGVPNDDCDDRNSSVSPGATEICGDNVDNNCNSQVDEGCSCSNGTSCGASNTCNLGTWSGCASGMMGVCSGGPPRTQNVYYMDADADGYCDLSMEMDVCPQDSQPTLPWKPSTKCTSITLTDCNDSNAAINPGAKELCGDGIDTDCDGQDSNGYNLGAMCNVKGLAAGSCLNGGTMQCSPVGSTMSACVTSDMRIGTNQCSTALVNGSYDVNCDGMDSPCCGVNIGCSPADILSTCPGDATDYCNGLTTCSAHVVCAGCGQQGSYTCLVIKAGPDAGDCSGGDTTVACH